jgi:hypothetical protein
MWVLSEPQAPRNPPRMYWWREGKSFWHSEFFRRLSGGRKILGLIRAGVDRKQVVESLLAIETRGYNPKQDLVAKLEALEVSYSTTQTTPDMPE